MSVHRHPEDDDIGCEWNPSISLRDLSTELNIVKKEIKLEHDLFVTITMGLAHFCNEK